MKIIILLTLAVLTISCSINPKKRSEIKDWSKLPMSEQFTAFTSDGCSFFPEGTKLEKNKWIKCCVIHDMEYWIGGTEKLKLAADKRLKQCVASKDAEVIAKMMFQGVQIGGRPQYQTDFRWGYGWNYNRGYLPVHKKEMDYIKSISPKKGDDLRKYILKGKLDPEVEVVGPIKL